MSGRYEKKSRKKGKKVVWIVLAVILALILGAVLGGVIYYNAMLNKLNLVSVPEIIYTFPSEEPTEATTEAATEEVTVPKTTEETTPPTQPHVPSSEDYINILIVGQDSREGEASRLADSIMLCTINTYTKTLTTTSILRDAFVKMPDYRTHTGGRIKLTTIYNLGYVYGDGIAGSMELMNMTLFRNFGIEVDHNFEVDFEAFIRVVDSLGGIEIELTEAETKYMNDADYVTGRQFEPGVAHMDGRSALLYARMRHADGDSDSDIARTRRQRAVIETVLTKLKSTDLSEVQRIVNDVLPLVSTSMSKSDITTYLMELLPILPDLKFENGGTCPASYLGDLVEIYHDGVMHSVLRFDEAQTIKAMRQVTEGEIS